MTSKNAVLVPPSPLHEYVAANGDIITTFWSIRLEVMICNLRYAAEFIVADVNVNIIGYDVLLHHDLILFHQPA